MERLFQIRSNIPTFPNHVLEERIVTAFELDRNASRFLLYVVVLTCLLAPALPETKLIVASCARVELNAMYRQPLESYLFPITA